MRPVLVGLDDPRYLSLAGAVLINGNPPVRSGYSNGAAANDWERGDGFRCVGPEQEGS